MIIVADHLITVVDAYQLTILELERSVLIKATLAAVQSRKIFKFDTLMDFIDVIRSASAFW